VKPAISILHVILARAVAACALRSRYLSRHRGHGHYRVITDMHRLRIITNRFLPESGESHLIRGICDAAN
jgi:uncharacterized membrane protein YgcG